MYVCEEQKQKLHQQSESKQVLQGDTYGKAMLLVNITLAKVGFIFLRPFQPVEIFFDRGSTALKMGILPKTLKFKRQNLMIKI